MGQQIPTALIGSGAEGGRGQQASHAELLDVLLLCPEGPPPNPDTPADPQRPPQGSLVLSDLPGFSVRICETDGPSAAWAHPWRGSRSG